MLARAFRNRFQCPIVDVENEAINVGFMTHCFPVSRGVRKVCLLSLKHLMSESSGTNDSNIAGIEIPNRRFA